MFIILSQALFWSIKRWYSCTMSKMHIFSLFLLFTSILSCQKESITPIAHSQTIVQQRKKEPIHLSYPIMDMGVDRIGGGIRKVPLIGGILRKFTEVFADITIRAKGTKVEIEPTRFSFPELDDVDFSIIQNINLEQVILKINDEDQKKKNINFIKKMKVLLNVYDEQEGDIVIRILDYDRDLAQDDCQGKCIRMNVTKNSWKEILSKYRDFTLNVELIIDSVPKSQMSIDGVVDFSIGIDLGF